MADSFCFRMRSQDVHSDQILSLTQIMVLRALYDHMDVVQVSAHTGNSEEVKVTR